MKKLVFTAVFVAMAVSIFAQGNLNEVRPISDELLIQAVTIITPDTQLLDQDIYINNGLIMELGRDLSVPPAAKVLNAKGHFAYPGFIAGLTTMGFKVPKTKSYVAKDPGNPNPRRVGINPDHSALDHLNVNDKELKALKKLGFTTIHIAPTTGMLPGKGGLVSLIDSTNNKAIQKKDISMIATFQGSGLRRTAPGTAIGVMAKLKDLYKQAQQRMAYEERYAKQPEAMQRLDDSPLHDAFYPVLKNEQKLFFQAALSKDIERVFDLQQKLGFQVVLTDVKHIAPIVDKVKERDVAVLASLVLPKEITEKKKEPASDTDKEKQKKKKKESEPVVEKPALSTDELAFEERRKKTIAELEANSLIIQDAGIPFAFSLRGVKTKDIRKNLNRIKKAGLSESALMSALTLEAAKILGIERTNGSIENGKFANIFITDKPYFESKSKVVHVIVEGKLESYNDEQTKTKNEDASQ